MNRIFCRVARVSFAVVVAAQALLNAQVTTYRINCGATFAYQDPSGYAWTYDGWPQPAFISSSSGTVSDQAYWNFGIPPPQISYTTSDPIYWAAKTVGGFPGAYMEYQFQVPNGYYGVRLKFVEIDPNVAVGGRRFNVDLNGSNVLTLFDILAAAGDRNRAIDKEYPVTVTDGNIRIRLTAIVSNAVISGIEILPVIGSAFADVPPTHLHHATVQFMRDKFITSGCATVHYCPDRSLTRGEMAVFLVRAIYWAITGNVEGAPTLTDPGFTYSSTPYFTDVPMDHPFFKYIQEIKELRVTSGTTATTYDPNRVLTVGEVAAFTVHALEFLEKGKVLALDHPDRNEYVVAGQWCFSDVPPGHIWYKIFGRIHQLGVMTGNCVTYGSATPNVSSGEAGDVLRGLMSRFVAIGIDKQGSTGTGGGGGGGSTSSAVREYIRLGGRVVAVETSGGTSGGGSGPGTSGFLVRPPSINLTTGGATYPFVSDVPATWRNVSTGAPLTSGQYLAPPTIPNSCQIGGSTVEGRICVYSELVEAKSTIDQTKKGFAVVTLEPGGAGGGGGVTLSPSLASYGAGAAAGSFTVTASPGVSWVASASQSWITLTSSSNGIGSGTVSYSVMANTGAARSGAVVVSGVSHTINQAAGTAQQVQVSVSSSASQLRAGQQVQLTASVTGSSNQNVTWSEATYRGGWFSSTTSNPTTYTASGSFNSGTIDIVATSQADPTKSGSVTLSHQPGMPLVESATPNAGTGQSATITFRFKHDDGIGALSTVEMNLWASQLNTGCHLILDVVSDMLYLHPNGGTAPIGQTGQLDGDNCTVRIGSGTTRRVPDYNLGDTLDVTVVMDFKSPLFGKTLQINGKANAQNGYSHGPVTFGGGWNVP